MIQSSKLNLMNKIISIFLLIYFASAFIVADINAVRLLPRINSNVKKIKPIKSGSGVGASVRLRSDKKAINLTLTNLGKARSIAYTLIYKTNGKDEGVSGSIDTASTKTISRELLFGTCSAGVCKYHSGLSNMTLEISIESVSGKKYLRRFRIRV